MNDDLKSKITVFMNGKILKSVNIFSDFPLEFLSNLTFIFQQKSFTLEEYVFNEGNKSLLLYIILFQVMMEKSYTSYFRAKFVSFTGRLLLIYWILKRISHLEKYHFFLISRDKPRSNHEIILMF